MSAVIGAGQAIGNIVEGNPGGVLDAMGEIGMTAPQLQELMRQGFDASNFTDNVAEMVYGWLSTGSSFAGDVGDLTGETFEVFTEGLDPKAQFKLMSSSIYKLSSSSINRAFNLTSNPPFYIPQLTSFSNLLPKNEAAAFPMPEPGDYLNMGRDWIGEALS